MGLLKLLNRRPSADVNSESIAHQASTMAAPSRPGSQGIRSALGNTPRISEERPQSSHSRSNTLTEGSSSMAVKPRLVGITEGQTIDCRDSDESKSQQKRPKSSRRNLRDAARGLTLNTGFANAGDKSPLRVLSPMSPSSSSASGPQSRRPSAFVDILDASGEIRTYDFRSRVHAAGAREYGEDVADRNMRENAIASPLKSAHATSFPAPLPFRTHRGSDAQSLYTRLPSSKDGLNTRKPSLAISLRQQSKPSMMREEDEQSPAFVAKGSVRAAREALRAGGHAGVRAGRIQSPVPPLPHHKLENYYDWSRFNKSGWDDASSSHSDGPRPSSISRSSYRQGSFASSVPPLCEPYSPQTSGARSIRRAQTPSVDLPHASFFREMKFGGACSRSLRSRGGDSSIAPDEDSCGDSVFISPATPVKDGSLGLLPGRRFKGGFNPGAFESTAIYDSDTESRLLRPDGEALLSKDDKDLDEFFDKADDDTVPAPRWAETPLTPIDLYELGDDERSIAGDMARHRQKTRNTRKPFTQRERMLALGYDYDSDSDVEASVDSDEMPEERALKLLNSLIGSGGSARVEDKDEQAVNMKVNMNTVAKLRREIRKRRRTGAAGRRVGRSSESTLELELNPQGDESRNETI